MHNDKEGGLNWTELRDSVLRQFPLLSQELNPHTIRSFVHQTIKHFLPHAVVPDLGWHPIPISGLDHEMFETHRSVFVRFRLPDGFTDRNMRIFANKRKLKVVWNGTTEEITLPEEINPAKVSARQTEGILEIRLAKTTSDSESFREVFIHE